MSSDWFRKISGSAFNLTAFAIFGLLFIARPTTLVPSLVLLSACITVLLHADFRSRCLGLFATSQYKWIARAMLAWFFVALLLAFIHRTQDQFYFPDNALRMFMALTLLAMAPKPRATHWFLCGVFLAGMASIYWALQVWPWSAESRAQGTTNNAIHFGNLSAIVMMLSITVAFFTPGILFKTRVLFLITALGGGMGAVASLSRSSFVVLLCLMPLGLVTTHESLIKWLQRCAVVAGVAACLAVVLSSTVRDKLRITEAVVDVQYMQDGNYMSSLGARAAMWKTAWHIFKEHPFVGVGAGRFQAEIVRRIQTGEIPNTGIYNQPHSDIMHALSAGGLLKFLSYLGILVAPFTFFYQRFCAVDINAEMRLTSILGMQVVGAYFLTGLTNSNFDLQIYSTTYAVLVCVLAKLSWQVESA